MFSQLPRPTFGNHHVLGTIMFWEASCFGNHHVLGRFVFWKASYLAARCLCSLHKIIQGKRIGLKEKKGFLVQACFLGLDVFNASKSTIIYVTQLLRKTLTMLSILSGFAAITSAQLGKPSAFHPRKYLQYCIM